MRRYLEIEHLLKLSLAVYRVTAIFPAREELGLKIRESANRVLADLLLEKIDENVSRQIRELLGCFDEAESKNWVDSRNFLVLRREYSKMRQAIGVCENSEKTVDNHSNGNGQNGHRQDLPAGRHGKILEVMNGNGMVKIGELIKMFPEINRRTVLRDLDRLCQTGTVVRNGNGRGAHYVKNGINHDTLRLRSG